MYKRDFNDHELASYLRAEGVLDNYITYCYPTVNEYRRADGRLVAVIVFDNRTCERFIYTYNDKFLI